ncbi:hypothetical protein HQ544_00870 [Candidatus Falkowbacteria bacterium]|nr:hypothetical protein [Candidatus Falkowbacteria bacterium]
MKLKQFLQQLKKANKNQTQNPEIILADGRPVTRVVFSSAYKTGKSLVVTDE